MENKPLTKKQKKALLLAEANGSDKDLLILDSIGELEDMIDERIGSVMEAVQATAESLSEELKKKSEEELSYEIDPEEIRGLPGKDGSDYVLTMEDKAEIAMGIEIPIVEKVIEKIEVIREQPVYNVTNEVKEVAVAEKPEEIRDKLESLKDDDRLDKKAIKGLEKLVDQDNLDRAVSILDQRTSFLINKVSNIAAQGGGSGGASGLLSFISPVGSLSIGGTLTDPTIDINLSHENTWTTGQIFNDADVTKTPLAPATSSASFVLDAGGIIANNSAYNYYVYSYWYTGTTYAYDSVGIFTAPNPPTGIDPNDGLKYRQDLSWAAGSDANGYIILDFMNGSWLDVGNVTSYSIDTSTSWLSAGSFPALSPTSLVEAGHPLWANKATDWGTTDFNVLALGLSGTNHLQFRWMYAGGISAAGALRFESDDGVLRQINADIYGNSASFLTGVLTGTLTATNVNTTNASVSSIATKQVLFSSSGTLVGDAGYEYDSANNRLLLSNASISPTSRLHIHDSGATAIYTQYTNSASGSTSTDGFFTGISTTGVAELRQRENLALETYTNNTKRLEILAGGNVGIGTAGTVNAKLDVLAPTEQFRILYDASNSVQFTVSSGGNLSLQTTALATAGVYTLTPHGAGGDGTNRTINFGTAWGNAALWLYSNGAATRFGWGMRADAMQFFAPSTTGGLFSWNRGGDLQATGTNELMRLTQYAVGAGLGIGRASASPYLIEGQGISAAPGVAGVEDFIRIVRAQAGGVSYPDVFAMGIGRYSSSGFGPDTRVDFKLKSTGTSTIESDITVMSLNANARVLIGSGGAANSTLHVSGSLSTAYVEKTALYTLADLDHTVNWTSGTVTGTLPTAVGITGRTYVLKNTGSGVITIATTSSQTIDGIASGVLTLLTNDVLVVQSTGANWIIIN